MELGSRGGLIFGRSFSFRPVFLLPSANAARWMRSVADVHASVSLWRSNFWKPRSHLESLFSLRGWLDLFVIAPSGVEHNTHKALDFIRLCLVLPPPSYSALCLNPLSTCLAPVLGLRILLNIYSMSFSCIKVIGSRPRSREQKRASTCTVRGWSAFDWKTISVWCDMLRRRAGFSQLSNARTVGLPYHNHNVILTFANRLGSENNALIPRSAPIRQLF